MMAGLVRLSMLWLVLTIAGPLAVAFAHSPASARMEGQTRVSITNGRWHINGKVTYPGARAEGLLT
jgi:hypothetical protein